MTAVEAALAELPHLVIAREEAARVYRATCPERSRSIRTEERASGIFPPRPAESYRGPAAPEVIQQLIEALHPTRDDGRVVPKRLIEQAFARGWDDEQIAASVHVPIALIHLARLDFDELSA